MADALPSGVADRIDAIPTRWSLLELAHRGPADACLPARQALVLRYRRAIRGYVGALLQDEAEADDLAQEAIVRFLQGDFANASPERGRFRDLLKVALRNMVRNHWEQQRRRPAGHLDPAELPDLSQTPPDFDAEWNAAWSKSLVANAWHALEDHQRKHPGNVMHTLLRLRTELPEADTATLAAELAKQTPVALSPAALRQQLHRARTLFAELLLQEVREGMDESRPGSVEQEFVELGLMPFLRRSAWHS